MTSAPTSDEGLVRRALELAAAAPRTGDVPIGAVVVDATAGKALTSDGEFAGGGLASPAFYVDPVEEITARFFTQLMPSSTYAIRPQLRTLVTQALVA